MGLKIWVAAIFSNGLFNRKSKKKCVCVKKNLINRDVVKMEERDSGGIEVLKLEKIEEKRCCEYERKRWWMDRN